MSEKKIYIQDESGDKKYFTIIPNFILNHSTAIDQALYIQMKRIAGDNGTCEAGYRYFIEKLGIGYKAYKKSLDYLLSHNWIDFVGTKKIDKKRGEKEVNVYRVNDLWKMNNDFYCGAERNRSQVHCGAESNLTAVSKETHCGAERKHKKNIQEEHIKNISCDKVAEDEKIPNLLDDKKIHIQIIGLLAKIKDITFISKEQQQSFIRRNLRAAQSLMPYDIEKIEKTMEHLKNNANFKWTLETVGKYIDENINILKYQSDDDWAKNF